MVGVVRALSDRLERNALVVVALAVPGTVLALLARRDIKADTWFALVGGRVVAHTGPPERNTLTVLHHGGHWVDQQWLGQLVVYELWSHGGWALPLIAASAVYVGSFALAAAGARSRGASERATAIVVAACFVLGLPDTVLRAQIIAFLLFTIVLLILLADERRRSRRVFLVVPLLLIWANVHGSVLLGVALAMLRGATYGLDMLRGRRLERDLLRRGTALLVLSPLCLFASPYGLSLAGYYRHFLTGSALTTMVTEWAPSSIRSEPEFFLVLAVATYAVARQHRTLGLFPQLALAATAVEGLLAERNIVWFALASAAIVPSAVDGLWHPTTALRRAAFNSSIALMSLAALVGAEAIVSSRPEAWFETSYPRAAVAAVGVATKQHSRDRIFATEEFADWLLFEQRALAGRVAFDVRFELLSDAELDQLTAFESERGVNWRAAAAGYALLVLPSGGGPARDLRREGAHVLYRDSHLVVLRRDVTAADGA